MAAVRDFLSGSRSFILGAAIGSGMTARAAERAGADFVLALNAGRFRAMGGSSPDSILPIRDCNDFVAGFARTEILPNTGLPVFFGACTFDPRLDIDAFLSRVTRWGVAGIANFPSVIHLDETRRSLLEEVGLGYSREINLLVEAAKRGLMTIGYTRSPSDARRMVDAGIEAVCMNFNLNPAQTGGTSSSIGLGELATRTREMARVVHGINRHVICLLGGGPITRPDELLDVCRETGAQGFIGGSSLDRVPLETSVLEITSGFKTIHMLRERVDRLERQVQLSGYRLGIVAHSASMNQVLENAKRLASGANPVLIAGEPGTGKRRLAALVHALGGRKHRKPITFPCRSAPAGQNLAGLFGTERDDSTRRRISALEAGADTSVLILHLEELSPEGQNRLADFLETGTFAAANGVASFQSNAKVVATITLEPNQNPEDLLVPRLAALFSGFSISLPPLKDRLEDLPLLIQHFTVKAKGDSAASALLLENSAFLALAGHGWPNNVRELRHVIEQLVTLPPGTRITAEAVEPLLGGAPVRRIEQLSEREWIIEGLKRNKLHRGRTARYLGMSRKTLYNKIKRLKILD